MSMTFYTVMGYGMPLMDFDWLSQLSGPEDVVHRLDDRFKNIALSLETLDSPDKLAEYRSDTVIPRHDVFIGSLGLENGSCSDSLYHVIANEDDYAQSHIVFFPSLDYRSRWMRANDDLDLALLHRWNGGSDRDFDPSRSPRVQYVSYGFGPWRNHLMNQSGQPVAWENFPDLRGDQTRLPAVPLEIRYYLTELGILDHEGVNQLRPIIAAYLS